MSRRKFLIVASCLAMMASMAYAVDGVSPNTILIGQSISLEGGKNDYGTAVLAGMHTYLNAVNQSGGVKGRRVVLKTMDDEGRPEKAESNARHLVAHEKVFLLFGSIEGGPSTAVMKAAVDLKVPFFAPIAGSPMLRHPHQPLVFPMRAEHLEEFRALLEYAKEIGLTRVVFFRSDSQTGLQHLENMKRECRNLGIDVVLDLPFRKDISDDQLGRMASSIAASHGQVVINHGDAAIYERLIRKARSMGVRASFNAVNSGSAQLANRLGEMAHGMVFAQVVPSPWERKTAITREYQEEFARQHPGQPFSYGSLEGFLTAKALVLALQLAGNQPTREKFSQALYSAGTFDLGGLRVSYQPGDHSGSTMVDLAIVTREGKFRH
jgi:branched-chain amino acid transport system substrate-binding protein